MVGSILNRFKPFATHTAEDESQITTSGEATGSEYAFLYPHLSTAKLRFQIFAIPGTPPSWGNPSAIPGPRGDPPGCPPGTTGNPT